MMNPRSFNYRAFVALIVAITGVAVPLTAVLGHGHHSESSQALMGLHGALGLVFVIFSIWHVVLNRRALLNYTRSLTGRVPAVSREALAAVAVVVGSLSLWLGHAFFHE